MTEAQALELARKLYVDWVHNRDEAKRINSIKEALMQAYNDGWENGFEEAKTIFMEAKTIR